MANEGEKGRVPAAESSTKNRPISARDPADDEKGALLDKEREAAEKLNPSVRAGEIRHGLRNQFTMLHLLVSDSELEFA
ncbi:hypothetical protein Y032_0344g3086 [Ancylostoma ceylanicum]|nr:hypothetical protein Y032_0344g3086 [Ancylostoma ceylanicum]